MGPSPDAELLRLFDRRWYEERYPEAVGGDLEGLEYYLSVGSALGHSPNMLFDETWYQSEYAQASASGKPALLHYVLEGAQRGFRPNPDFPVELFSADHTDGVSPLMTPLGRYLDQCALVEEAGLFDRERYLSVYPDVAEAGMDPLLHYMLLGAAEGRNPHDLFATTWYRVAHPSAMSERLNPLVHYVLRGSDAGFDPHPAFPSDLFKPGPGSAAKTPLGRFIGQKTLIEASCLLDKEWYLSTYPDIAEAGAEPVQHYLLHGVADGRDPNPFFATAWYLSQYPEVRTRGVNPLIHYIVEGSRLGYAPHPAFPGLRAIPGFTALGSFFHQCRIIEDSYLFERDWYLHANPRVAAGGGNPLHHYVLHGIAEGLNPNRLFDTRWYLSEHPEVAESGVNPLAHYVVTGAALGYRPHPFFPAAAVELPSSGSARGLGTPLGQFLARVVHADPTAFPRFSAYDVFKVTDANLRRAERPECVRHIDVMTFLPDFTILIGPGRENLVRATVASVERQIYTRSRIVTSQQGLAAADEGSASFLMWLDAGDELDVDALYALAAELNADPSLEILYFDHDIATGDGLSEPLHKPGWSPDHLECSDYVGSAACFSSAVAADALASASDRYDLLLRMTERTSRIARIGRVLLSKPRASLPAAPEADQAALRSLEGRLARTGREGRVEIIRPGCYAMIVAVTRPPLVSIVIPTAGRVIEYQGRHIDLIVKCIESIVDKSTYKNVEFVVVDNGDFDRERLSHIAIERLKFVTYPLLEVNIARKINLGASHASGSVILILNDDIEVIAEDWIERMLAHLEKPHVGVVGAKLVYPDSLIQHVGMVACGGHPEHVRRGWPRSDVGYAFSTCGVRNYLSVTGAVSMATMHNFLRVGGYSENLPIDYNDVDFCYKMIREGLFVVYEPLAELIHYESVSFARSPRPDDAEYFAKRWASIASDPYYDEYRLSKHPATFEPSYTERRH